MISPIQLESHLTSLLVYVHSFHQHPRIQKVYIEVSDIFVLTGLSNDIENLTFLGSQASMNELRMRFTTSDLYKVLQWKDPNSLVLLNTPYCAICNRRSNMIGVILELDVPRTYTNI